MTKLRKEKPEVVFLQETHLSQSMKNSEHLATKPYITVHTGKGVKEG